MTRLTTAHGSYVPVPVIAASLPCRDWPSLPCWPTFFLAVPASESQRARDQSARWSARNEVRTNDLAWRERAHRLGVTGWRGKACLRAGGAPRMLLRRLRRSCFDRPALEASGQPMRGDRREARSAGSRARGRPPGPPARAARPSRAARFAPRQRRALDLVGVNSAARGGALCVPHAFWKPIVIVSDMTELWCQLPQRDEKQ